MRRPPADARGRGGGTADSGAYTVRLRGLEKNVNELKEQIFRTKARLNLLKETVLGGVIGASRAHHPPQERDGQLVPPDQGGLRARRRADLRQDRRERTAGGMQEFDVYNGAIQPGSHTLSRGALYQGNGFGVFSYLKGYKFKVKSSHTFVAGESKSTEHHRRRLREGQHHDPALRQASRSTSASTSWRPAKARTAAAARRRSSNGGR